MSRVQVKICGITRLEDAHYAEWLGADFLGFIFYQGSLRYIAPKHAETIISSLHTAKSVGVFVDTPKDEILLIAKALKLWAVQVYHDIDIMPGPQELKLIKSLRVQAQEVAALAMLLPKTQKDADYVLLDAYHQALMGGVGQKFDWTCLPKDLQRVFLAGGINAKNVAEAIKLKPFALDLSSSVELAPGIKDHAKLDEFFRAVNRGQQAFALDAKKEQP